MTLRVHSGVLQSSQLCFCVDLFMPERVNMVDLALKN